MFTLTIQTGGAAFEYAGTELARILHRVADDLAANGTFHGSGTVSVRDINGNTCGSWSFTAEDDERGACILTGADGEDAEDCTTHGHEDEPEFDEDARRAAYALGGEYMHTGGTL